MLYLLDANVLIDANRDYYPLDRVPEFWDWLVEKGNESRIQVPLEQYEEIITGNDELVNWAKGTNVKQALLLNEEVNGDLVAEIVDSAYANDLTDDEIEKIGRDPFLIAYALIDIENRCVVTTEASKPSRQRANRHIPDVCNALNIPWCNTFTLLRKLDFKTGWNR